MMKRNSLITSSAVLIAVLQIIMIAYGCGVQKKGTLIEQLQGEWAITQIDSIEIVPQGDTMTFRFNFEEGRVGGMGYCNSFGGTFSLSEDGSCTFGDIFSTRVGCPGNRVESLLSVRIQSSKKLRLKGNTLSFYGDPEGKGTPLLIMTRKKGPEAGH